MKHVYNYSPTHLLQYRYNNTRYNNGQLQRHQLCRYVMLVQTTPSVVFTFVLFPVSGRAQLSLSELELKRAFPYVSFVRRAGKSKSPCRQ